MKRITKEELQSFLDNSIRIIPYPESESFVDDFMNLFYDGGLNDLLNYFKTEYKGRFTKGNLEATDRVLKHWENLGIIPANRTIERGWRALSYMDHVWTTIVITLRNFGYSLDSIKLIKEQLSKFKESVNSDYPILMVFYAYAVSQRDIIYLVVFENGGSELALRKDYLITLASGKQIPDHIIINVSNIMQSIDSVFPEENQNKVPSLQELSSKESRIIEIIREPEATQIIIHKNQQELDRVITTSSKIGQKDQLKSELNSLKFGAVEIKKANNQIVQIITSKSEKL